MFGIVEQPCVRQASDRREWMAHLCGLCLTLRDNHGQLSRVTTNRDTVLLSALYEAQVGEVDRTRAAPCPLRHFRTADVVAASTAGVRFASAVTLLLASVAVEDKVADGELRPAALRAPATGLARRWRRDGLTDAAHLGFDGTALLGVVAEQAALEAAPGLPFGAYASPTERSVGDAFAHTAVLAGRPGNAEPLNAAGRRFGRIAYLLDAVEDRDGDRRHGRFNALDAASPSEDARGLFGEAHRDLRRHLGRTDLARPGLVRFLLGEGLHRAARRVLDGDRRHHHPPPTNLDGKRPPRWVTGLLGGWAASVGICGSCVVCVHGIEEACENACEDACDEACNDACSGCDCNCDCEGCNCEGCDCSGCDCTC